MFNQPAHPPFGEIRHLMYRPINGSSTSIDGQLNINGCLLSGLPQTETENLSVGLWLVFCTLLQPNPESSVSRNRKSEDFFMTNNENQYTIYIRSTKESIPVSKEEFDAYYHDINIYRIRQQRHGRCVCPASKRLTCDMDCLTCPFHRMGDMRSLDYTETDDEGNETAWVDEIPDDSPLLEDIIIEASEMKALYARLTELMPEAIKIGEMRLEGLSEEAIGERIGIGRKTFAYRLKKVKAVLEKEFPDIF